MRFDEATYQAAPKKAEEEGESVKLPPPSTAGSGDKDAGGANIVNPDPDGGTGDGGADGGGGGSCAAANPCASATNLGNVSGDTGADTKNAQGSTSEWLTVRVTEDDSDIAGVPLWLKANLTSPPGTNFELHVYVPGSDTQECSAVTKSSTNASGAQSASVEFGEGSGFSNGSSDDRPVTIEVRHVSGTCDRRRSGPSTSSAIRTDRAPGEARRDARRARPDGRRVP